MRIVITGANGQLGRDLVRHCATVGDDVVALGSADLDITDRVAVRETIAHHAPEALINAAAYTAVDAAETDVARAHAVNALGVRWLADAARRAGAHLVHVSTDYVFDGTKATPYTEWDATNPRTVYGASKLAGEAEALACPGAAVVRTSWVCSEHGHNMVKTVLGLRDRPELRFVDDQRGSPTFTHHLAPMLGLLATERIPGLFHMTNQGETSWYGFVRDILEAAGADPDIVVPISTAELDPPRPAERPANSVLENAALKISGMPLLPDYHDGLRQVVTTLLS